MSEKMIKSSVCETLMTKTRVEESSGKDDRDETWEEKLEKEDGNTERNKFKKVEMLVFNGEDPDSWLFRANRYLQIHKLTN